MCSPAGLGLSPAQCDETNPQFHNAPFPSFSGGQSITKIIAHLRGETKCCRGRTSSMQQHCFLWLLGPIHPKLFCFIGFSIFYPLCGKCAISGRGKNFKIQPFRGLLGNPINDQFRTHLLVINVSVQLTLPVHPDPVRYPRALWPVDLQAADVLAKAGKDELGLGRPMAEKRILVTLFLLKNSTFPQKKYFWGHSN